MREVYYYVALLNAAVTAVVAIIVWYKNRRTKVGVLFGLTMLIMAVWAMAFGRYFLPLDDELAMRWAQVTLTMAILNYPFFFHSVCEITDRIRKLRWWIGASYGMCIFFVVLLWSGQLVDGIRRGPEYMDHYVRYNRQWYLLLGLYLVFWQWASGVLLGYAAYKSTAYKRMQFSYYVVAWLVIFLTFSSVILPIEYNINIPPVGFFVLPFNFVFMAYVTSQTRLADFSVVVTRVLLHTITLLVVVATTMLFVGSLTVLAPGFMSQGQILFTVFLVTTIALLLTLLLPRFFSRAERAVQDRLVGDRLGYQDVLAGLIKELSAESSIDTLLERVATALHSQMQVSRVLIFLQDPLMDEYRLLAQCGMSAEERDQVMLLTANGPITRWLVENKDSLVRDEQARVMPRTAWNELAGRLDQLRVSLCVPLLLEGKLTGVLCLGEKANGDMFYVSDLKLLTTLATEVALGVRYRRMEERAVRNNKLISLGTIAAGVAHEIRNPLASIRTFAQLLPTKHDDPEFKNEFSKLVLQDVERITKVIQSMLSFARPGTVNISSHTATDLIEEAMMLIQPRLRSKKIEVIRQFHNNLVLRVDRQLILQVLLNLLNNAVDALPPDGVIRLTTGVHKTEAQGEEPDRRYGVIEIADNGPGIPAALRNRLFDPFFTTKREGTGLGLSISQKIARDHGGFISVSSVEGAGAAFQVHLPLD